MPLKLSSVYDSIATGDMFLFRGRKAFSRMIKLWTRSPYSHVGIALRICIGGVDMLVVIEALEGRGVQLLPIEVVLRRDTAVEWFRLRPRVGEYRLNRDKVASFAISHWGARYASPRQFFRSFTYCGRFIRRLLRLPIDEDKGRFFCSELVAEALRKGGYAGEDLAQLKGSEMTPEDISRLMCLEKKGQVTL